MNPQNDPSPYTGPICRADGTRPWNGYLWPTERWSPTDEPSREMQYWSAFAFDIVALADGRFATEGFVHGIERNEYLGEPIVFPTREAAIRTAGARTIRRVRHYRFETTFQLFAPYKPEQRTAIINWIRNTVAKAIGEQKPRQIPVPPTPPPQPKLGQLSLFPQEAAR